MGKWLVAAVAVLAVLTVAYWGLTGQAERAAPDARTIPEPGGLAKAPEEKGGQAEPRRVNGTVIALDTQAGIVTITQALTASEAVRLESADHSLVATSGTELKGIRDLAELAVGDRVVATYTEDEDGRKIATSIERLPFGQAAPAGNP